RNSAWPVHDLARLRWNSHGRIGGRSTTASTERPEHWDATEWICANSERVRTVARSTQPAHDDARGHEEFARKRQDRRGGANHRSASPGTLSRVGESG